MTISAHIAGYIFRHTPSSVPRSVQAFRQGCAVALLAAEVPVDCKPVSLFSESDVFVGAQPSRRVVFIPTLRCP